MATVEIMEVEQVMENVESNEKSLKRKRDTSILDNFTKLTNGQEKIRVKSGIELLKYLTEGENVEKSEDELNYALGRLIRGLGSSNSYARAGFFAALVGLLNLKNISIETIFGYVATELHKGGNNSKSENADVCLGQVLVSGALLHSNLYEKCEDKEKGKILELLLNAGKERTYLNLASYKFLTELFHQIKAEEFANIVFPLIKPTLCKPWEEQNLDSLFLLAEVEMNFPHVIESNFLKNNLGTHELCNILTTIPRMTALKHPVFDLYIKKISESDQIIDFFNAMDQVLSRANRNKYFVATKLLTGVLENLNDSTVIPHILTKNYIQQTLNTYRTAVGRLKDKEFQLVSRKLFETLLNNLKKDSVKSKTKIKILRKLLFYPGTFIFEKVTKSKLVQNITSTLDVEGVKRLGAIYSDVILATKERVIDDNTSERWWNIDRVYASHLLVKLINHPSMHEEVEWKIEQLIFLMKLGLLNNQSENIGYELADSLKDTFYSSLDLKLTKLEDLRLILSRIFHEIDGIIRDNLTILRHPITQESFETWTQTVELATKLNRKTKKKKVVFHILFLHLGLQIFNNSKLALDSLKELFSCYERVKKSTTEKESNSDDPLWIEVVVDLFLNLLSHNSHLLRSVINCVFPHLCKYMNTTAIHQILSVLDPNNESNPLSNSTEESDEDENEEQEENSSDESEESDEGEKEEDEDNVNNKLRMALHQALGNNAGSDAESIDLDNLNEEEGERLNEALGEAFKQFKPNLGRRKKQRKDDEILTHFRVRVLDLIEIYLNTNPSMLLTLEIMLPLLQTLEFSIRDDHQKPLQDRVRACLKKLSSLKRFSDFEDVNEEVLISLLKSLLDRGRKTSTIVQDMGEKIAECCIFIINCSNILNEVEKTKKNKKKNYISFLIKDSLEAFFQKRDCLIPYVLFKSVLRLNWEGILDLVPVLVGFVFTQILRPFRRSQAIELLKLFYNNHRFLNSHQEEIKLVEECTVNLILDCIGFFKEFCDNPTEEKVKEKFICNLFELLNEIKSSSLASFFNNWEAVGNAVQNCRSKITLSQHTKVVFNKLCRNLNISNVVQMQENILRLNNIAQPIVANTQEKQQKKKRKHFNKEKLKEKKESKELRLQSLSEGFSKRKISWEDTDDFKKIKAS